MKSRSLSVLAMIAIVSLAACGNAGDNKSADAGDHAGHNHAKEAPAPATQTAPAVAQIKDDMLDAVYRQYASLTTALVESDMAKAKIAANAIEAGAKELKGADAVGTAATRIAAAKDIEAQRVAYSDLSNNLISLVKKAGMHGGELYVDFCPMAMNDKGGYWISGIKEIRNPYFGDKMMKCGEVKETLQ
ncbi:MAG: DUF3347 domain-containing protein [Chitinophagaceae bacterium]|nr:DUF3347 domain-containing protein [Chitinophagaceae bacterium]